MNTIIPIFINSEDEPAPKCPYCKKKLEGWSPPSDFSLIKFFSLIIISFVLIMGILSGGAAGVFFGDCDPWFSKRWHYVVPTFQVSCQTTKWLTK